jgi:peptidoglycan/LPS O-acetylase OafA/YrhL
VLASCLLFGAWALLPDELTNLGKHTMAAAAFVANLAFWRESAYFAPAAELEPMLHLWSLCRISSLRTVRFPQLRTT